MTPTEPIEEQGTEEPEREDAGEQTEDAGRDHEDAGEG